MIHVSYNIPFQKRFLVSILSEVGVTITEGEREKRELEESERTDKGAWKPRKIFAKAKVNRSQPAKVNLQKKCVNSFFILLYW